MPAATPESLFPRKRPTQARAQERVRLILDAAREIAKCEPIESVTTTAIAERAGLPVGSLYQYFPNRLAILAEVGRGVLREIDDATVARLRASASVPWESAVDAVIDGTLASHQAHDDTKALFRTLVATPELSSLADESNRRLAGALSRHPALAHSGLPRAEVQQIARVVIQAGDAVQHLVLGAGTETEAAAMATEMKKLLRAYLALYLEASSSEPSLAGDSPEPTEVRT
ncbi:MAG: TetR/AcrR family transcriptional regulator [Deltaproteobacteria bacterium]|nr:TetR/AcrR family transcriptional regulator [Deltaproteobacteria bacterium]MBW2446067.1 TetR/AcrR family transcriptional regulator [Deltaproteobacteria bacterium]